MILDYDRGNVLYVQQVHWYIITAVQQAISQKLQESDQSQMQGSTVSFLPTTIDASDLK